MTEKYKIPKPLSPGEEAFWRDCRVVGLSPEREYKFCDGRLWAFDFAWPDELIAVEVEGGTAFGKSRHSRGKGFENDCLKYNMAARLGWRVLRYTTEMVVSGHAIDDVQQILLKGESKMRISDERLKMLTACFGIVAASNTDPMRKSTNLDTYHALAELMVRRQYGQEYIDELLKGTT